MSTARQRHAIGHQEQRTIVLVHALADGRQDVVGTLPVAGDDEHPKCLPAVVPRVFPVVLGGGVGEEFPLEAGLHEVPAIDRHGAAITFDEEGAEPAIGVADGEHIVGSNAEVVHAVVAVNLRAHHPRLLAPPRFLRARVAEETLRPRARKPGRSRIARCNATRTSEIASVCWMNCRPARSFLRVQSTSAASTPCSIRSRAPRLPSAYTIAAEPPPSRKASNCARGRSRYPA